MLGLEGGISVVPEVATIGLHAISAAVIHLANMNTDTQAPGTPFHPIHDGFHSWKLP
jgi:hypothetical protein